MTLALGTTNPTVTTRRTRPASRWWWHRATAAVVAPEPAPIALTWGNRRPGSAGFARWCDVVAHRIDAEGLGSLAAEVDALVEIARTTGVVPVVTAILADASQPEPARTRAFGRVVEALAGLAGPSGSRTDSTGSGCLPSAA